MITKPTLSRSTLSVLMTGLLLTATAAVQAGPDNVPPTSDDIATQTLQPVDDPVMSLAWAEPGLDLSRYHKIMLEPAGMSFHLDDSSKRRMRSDEYPLSEAQKEHIRAVVLKAFTEEFGRSKQFTLTDRAGPDVLLVRGAIVDVVSRIPPERAGRGATFLSSLGEATLVVELRDSETDRILAQAADRRAVEPAFPRRSNGVNNLGEVQNAARRWARMLRHRLEQMVGA